MPISFLQPSAVDSSYNGFMRNRIINGAMVIDQRNAGAAVTPINTQYLVDRFSFLCSQASKFTAQQNAGSVTLPAGFTKYQGLTVASAYSVTSTDFFLLSQKVEGFNVADLAWGTANAATVTLSFRVYSSLTGTFGGAIRNGANNRFYLFSYTVSSANTWTSISVTIAGDTTGTWATDNTTGIEVLWGLGVGSTYSGAAGSWSGTAGFAPTGATSVVGTNGATFYITGVQLEVGNTATPFEREIYSNTLAKCQRYYYLVATNGVNSPYINGHCWQPDAFYGVIQHPVLMRTAPTFVATNTTNMVVYSGGGTYNSTAINVGSISTFCAEIIVITSGMTTGRGAWLRAAASGSVPALSYSAEL